MAGSIDRSDHVCRKLANQSGHAVLSVDYRLSPEHAFPAPLDDCINATRWAYTYAESALLCDSTRIAVCGDSAGGNMATLVTQFAFVPLKLQILVYPVTDMRCLADGAFDGMVNHSGNSYDTFGKGNFGLGYEAMQYYYRAYMGKDNVAPTGECI